MADVLGGPQGFLQYKMIETGMYEKLAKANGLAISGMQPKITMWNTGARPLVSLLNQFHVLNFLLKQGVEMLQQMAQLRFATSCKVSRRYSALFTNRPASHHRPGWPKCLIAITIFQNLPMARRPNVFWKAVVEKNEWRLLKHVY